ncbi:DEAD/DEAH box helicase [Nanoarchaeota archaeon]
MEHFKKLGLSKNLLKVIEELSFTVPSEIQEKAIPLVLKGKDVIGYAATGSGKTLAFGAGIAERVIKGKGVQALIMTPTRELAEQVADSVIMFSKHHKLTMQKVYGGVSMEPQIIGLRKAEVVIGTPGRLLDLLRRGTLKLDNLHILVLDEADRLVDMGFLPDVETIIKQCPKKRQTLLFSATSSPDMDYIQDEHMTNPTVIEVTQYVDPTKLTQVYYDVPTNLKFSLLVHLLKKDTSKLMMVFCNTKRNADIITSNLKKQNINALAIHGGLSQNKRTGVLKSFHDENIQVMVCTDVAARGLDIKNVSHVYNYDSPKNNKEYIHRIGRTARAGKEGKAISLVAERDYENFRNVINDSSLKIDLKEVPKIEKVPFLFKSFTQENRDYRGGSGFGRSSRFGRDNRERRPRSFGGRDERPRSFGGNNRGERDERPRRFGGNNRGERPRRFGGNNSSGSRNFGGRPRSFGGNNRFRRDSREGNTESGKDERKNRFSKRQFHNKRDSNEKSERRPFHHNKKRLVH